MQELDTLKTQTKENNLFKSQIEVIKKISNFVTKETEKNVLILFGENKSGKTFLLKNLQENPPNGTKSFFLDFNFENDFRTAELLKEISDVIKLTHEEYSYSGTDEKLVLFLDNFFVPKNEEKLFTELFEIANKNSKIKFVLSSTYSEDTLNKLNSDFRNNSDFIHLQYLNFEDVSKFLKTFTNPKFTPDAINRIFSLTEGQPYISEKMGEYLFNHLKIKGINSISKNEVDKNLIAVIKGLKDEGGKVELGAEILVKDKDGKELLYNEDLFAEQGEVRKEKASIVFYYLEINHLYKPNSTYYVETRMWDKKGDGEIKSDLEFEVVAPKENKNLTAKSDGMEVSMIKLYKNENSYKEEIVSLEDKLAVKVFMFNSDNSSGDDKYYNIAYSHQILDVDNNIVAQTNDQISTATGTNQMTGSINMSSNYMESGKEYTWKFVFKDADSDDFFESNYKLKVK